MEYLESLWNKFQPMLEYYGIQVITAIIILIIGSWIIKRLTNLTKSALHKRNVDPSLVPFLAGIVSALLRVILIITVISQFGIATTSFVAVLGAAGLAVGMALSGTLSNFAGGVMILLFKPFKVGDLIDAQGYMGTVKEIQIFNTILKTPDNKTIIIPNGGLSSGAMVNYSTEPKRRVDMVFGIGYEDDIDKAKGTLMGIIKADSRIINDPAEPFIAVSELADSSVNFVIRVWVNAADYWGVHFDLMENVKKEFDKNSISIPYPQTDVHLHQAS